MAEKLPEFPSQREVLGQVLTEQFSIVKPRAARRAGIHDPDPSVRAREAVSVGRAIDHGPTAKLLRRRVKITAGFALFTSILVAAGVDEAIATGDPGPLLGCLLIASPALIYAIHLARLARLLRSDNWRVWPAAHMTVDTSRLPWFLQSNGRVVRWMFVLFDFESDQRFVVSNIWNMGGRGSFDASPGKVWACGDPNGWIVLSPVGGAIPIVFGRRIFTTQKKFIESELSTQFPAGRPESWPESPDPVLPPQVEYEGPVVWPNPPGRTDEWDHEEAAAKRSVRRELE